MEGFMWKNFDLPENIFYFYNNNLQPLEFVLDWDSENGFYKQLLNRYFADVLDAPNEHALILAKPNETKYFDNQIPAFDIKYIEDCFTLKDYPDPNLYLIQNSCPVVYEKTDIYDCWYHKKKTWYDLIGSKADQKTNGDDNQNAVSKPVKWTSCSKTDSDASCSEDDVSSIESNIFEPKASSLSQSAICPNKKTRLPYSLKEDIAIVKYIIHNNYAFDVAGREMWEKMERSNVCKIRTWQSMKERYLKHIKWDLQSSSSKYPFLSKNDVKMLRQGLKIDAIKTEEKDSLKAIFLKKRIDSYASDTS